MSDYTPRASFEAFQQQMRERDRKGFEEYGERSLDKAPGTLLRELEEECIDIANWASILFDRLQRMRSTLEHLDGVARAIGNRRLLMNNLVAHYNALCQELDDGSPPKQDPC